MDIQLTDTETRVLGSLIEKEITTPEYYPLTLNSLIAACNQKSNRDPAMSLDEPSVVSALESLKGKRLVWHLTSGRAPKYDHNLRNVFPLSEGEIAILCTLMLRGPQTVGEIRTRTERMHTFESVDHVQQNLTNLSESPEGPFVVEIPRQPGQKESRFAHLLSGEPERARATPPPAQPAAEIPSPEPQPDRMSALEEDVQSLREELAELKKEFHSFKDQLGG